MLGLQPFFASPLGQLDLHLLLGLVIVTILLRFMQVDDLRLVTELILQLVSTGENIGLIHC